MFQSLGPIQKIKYLAIGLILVFAFQNCSDSKNFEEVPQNSRGTLYGNGSGHEGKATIPIDYVTDVSNDGSYQPDINFTSIVTSQDGHLRDVSFYCRSENADFEEGLDFILTKPGNTLESAHYEANFQSPTLPVGVSLSRTTPAKAWNPSTGFLETFPVNTPRLNVQGPNGSRGLLIEPSSSNVLLHSQDFLDPVWDLVRSNLVQSGSQLDPENNQGAFVLSEGTFTNYHYLQQTLNLNPAMDYSFSVYIKELQAGRGFSVRIYNVQGNDYRCSYSFETGEIFVNGRASLSNCTATSYPNGWVRLSVSAPSGNLSGPNQSRVKLELFNPSLASGLYTGSNHPGVLFWGAQVEALASPTSYIATTGTAQTRGSETLSIDHTARPISDGYINLNYSLQKSFSQLDISVSNGISENVTLGARPQRVQANIDGQFRSKIYTPAILDQALSLKVLNDKYTAFAEGQFVAENLASLGALSEVSVVASQAPSLIQSFKAVNESPINEVLAVSSLKNLETKPYGVLVLGRAQAQDLERVQTIALPLEEESTEGVFYSRAHDLSIELLNSLPGLVQIRGTLEDGTAINDRLQCNQTN